MLVLKGCRAGARNSHSRSSALASCVALPAPSLEPSGVRICATVMDDGSADYAGAFICRSKRIRTSYLQDVGNDSMDAGGRATQDAKAEVREQDTYMDVSG